MVDTAVLPMLPLGTRRYRSHSFDCRAQAPLLNVSRGLGKFLIFYVSERQSAPAEHRSLAKKVSPDVGEVLRDDWVRITAGFRFAIDARMRSTSCNSAAQQPGEVHLSCSRIQRPRRSALCRVSTAGSSHGSPPWQQELAEKLANRREYLAYKWNQSSIANGIHAGQDAIKDGWRSVDIGRTVDKEADALIEKWQSVENGHLKQWQKNVTAGVSWTHIFGPAVGGLVFAAFGILWTGIVWVTAIALAIPYALVKGRMIDTSALSAALHLALVQFITIFFWAAYKGYEWTMTRELTEDEKQRWCDDQELRQLHLDELTDFDTRLVSKPTPQPVEEDFWSQYKK